MEFVARSPSPALVQQLSLESCIGGAPSSFAYFAKRVGDGGPFKPGFGLSGDSSTIERNHPAPRSRLRAAKDIQVTSVPEPPAVTAVKSPA